MEPFGFTHLRVEEAPDKTVPTISNERYKKKDLNISKLRKSQQWSMRYLYYPVNTPVCRYQKRLVLDSLYNNILIALPKELDAFFVAAVVMFNFRRWFPMQKVVCICTNVESSVSAAKRFVEITGYSEDICLYANLKKNNRHQKWIQQDIIFATAEGLATDFEDSDELSEICLMVVEDAHRAVSGSHPLVKLIRNCILAKAKFRVLAITDCKIDKVGQLQLIVMNLQIDLIRSLSSIREDVSLAVASPRLCKLYITIDDHMRRVRNQLLEVMKPIASMLCENGIFPTNDLKKLANFSTSYLQNRIQNGSSDLVEIYCDFFELLLAYDILMCDGLTAFGNSLQALSTRSTMIAKTLETNDILKEACFLPTLSRPDDLQCHKLDMLVTLLRNTRERHGSEKSIVIVLCRGRDAAFVSSLILSLKTRLSEKYGFAFFSIKSGDSCQKISENTMKDRLCNVLFIPCASFAPEINVGYVDSIICMDEGLCSLRYTSVIKVRVEGNLLALCTAGYETNIYSFMGVNGTVDCVQADQISAVQLCTDVSPMMPCSSIPEIVEYWAEDIDQGESLLTMAERWDFQERLAFNSSLDRSKLIEDNCSLLNFCMQETFLWQDRPQRFALLGHGTLVPNLTKIFCRDPKILAEQVTKLQNRRKVRWMDEDSQPSKTEDATLMELHLGLDNDSKMQCSGKLVTEKRLTKDSLRKFRRKKVPRLNRIDSASFTLVKVLKPKLTANDFVNRMERHDEYRERIKQMTEIIQKLNDLICL